MDFILSKDARDWFSPIRGSLVAPTRTPHSPDFDVFYFCFMAGIIAKRKSRLPSEDERIAIVEKFPAVQGTRKFTD